MAHWSPQKTKSNPITQSKRCKRTNEDEVKFTNQELVDVKYGDEEDTRKKDLPLAALWAPISSLGAADQRLFKSRDHSISISTYHKCTNCCDFSYFSF